jgi:RHS repeat-associated protein
LRPRGRLAGDQRRRPWVCYVAPDDTDHGAAKLPGVTDPENSAVGLYYYRARYYDPTRSRFVSEDPIGFDGGDTNLFAYVRNSPPNLSDPAGLDVGWVDPPWHPGTNVATSCTPDDDCPSLQRKMAQLTRMIETHSKWDWQVPRPRGGNRHAKDIADLWVQYAKCQKFWLDKCECTSEGPSSIPFPVPIPGRAPQSSPGGSFGFGGGANAGGGLCRGLKPAFCQ